MDRRQKKTRKAIYGAFTELLKKESYSKITVQQIIDLADIGRTTFYSHFETKDDLLNALCSDIFDHVFSDDLVKEKNHDFSQVHDIRSQITHMLYHLKEHMDYLPGILSGESEDIFMSYFKKHLEELFSKVIVAPSGTAPICYLINHTVCDFAETVRWWTKNQSYSPEDICSFFYETIPANQKDS
ncbi:MAG: TetR/AcrR family transcriptional regulator [Lachnospiraceae bacterium]|nr:TetR/AcrR family transcriptional regulator [Lachnospiraceae bacterium]